MSPLTMSDTQHEIVIIIIARIDAVGDHVGITPGLSGGRCLPGPPARAARHAGVVGGTH